jgi:hypothetical protein
MATIYLSDEALTELDKQLGEYNDKNATTDRSGFIEHILQTRKKK